MQNGALFSTSPDLTQQESRKGAKGRGRGSGKRRERGRERKNERGRRSGTRQAARPEREHATKQKRRKKKTTKTPACATAYFVQLPSAGRLLFFVLASCAISSCELLMSRTTNNRSEPTLPLTNTVSGSFRDTYTHTHTQTKHTHTHTKHKAYTHLHTHKAHTQSTHKAHTQSTHTTRDESDAERQRCGTTDKAEQNQTHSTPHAQKTKRNPRSEANS